MPRRRSPEVNGGFDSYHGGRGRDLISVILECGHPIKLRAIPMHENARFPCANNSGCGYRLRWRKWAKGDGTERLNRSLLREEEDAGPED